MTSIRLVCWTAVFLLLTFVPVRADIISPGTHSVDRCVLFENADDVPGVTFLAWVGEIMDGGNERYYLVTNGVCMEKGYKFNSFSIEWYEGNPLIRAMPVTRSGKVVVSEDSEFRIYGGSVDDDNPVVAENLTYRFVAKGSGYGIELKSHLEQHRDSGVWVEKKKSLIASTPTATVLSSPTPEPTVTSAIEPAASSTPEPTATVPPEPTATSAVVPTLAASPVSSPPAADRDLFSGFWCWFVRLFGGTC